MMDRKKGYYWVKATPESSWEIAFFKKDLSFDGGWIFGICFVDEDFFMQSTSAGLRGVSDD